MKCFKVFMILAALGISQLSIAQSAFGVRLAANIATVEIKDDDSGVSVEPDSRVGLNFGLLLNSPITENFFLQPELNFIQKGYKLSILNSDVEAIMNYVEIPVLGKYAFGSENIGAFILFGPAIGFAINGKVKEGSNEEDIDFDRDMIKRLDLGLHFGAGITIPVGPLDVFIDARYLLGIADINDDSDDSSSTKHKGFNIGAGILIPMGE